MIYILEKSYIDEITYKQTIVYEKSKTPFDIHKIRLDYENGLKRLNFYKQKFEEEQA